MLLPLAFLSGVFAPVSAMPELAQRIIAFNPIFYVIDGFRYGMTGRSGADLITSIVISIVVNLGLFAWVLAGCGRATGLRTMKGVFWGGGRGCRK